MKRLLVVGLTSAALALAPALAQSATAQQAGAVHGSARVAAVSDTEGTYLTVTPSRLLDTRKSGGQVAAGGTRKVAVSGRAGVPTSGVSAVVVNLTATSGTRGGYLSAYPGGTTFSGTSALNFAAGETRANLVTVPLGSDGSITVLNGGGAGTAPVHVIVDIQGYYLDGATTPTRTPGLFLGAFDGFSQRLLDTRTNGFGPQGPGYYLTSGFYSDDLDPIVAYAVNVTAVNPTAAGYLVAWDGATDVFPTTSALNFAKGRTTPNNVVIPAVETYDPDEGRYYYQFAVGNASSSAYTNVVIDLVGVYMQTDQGEVFRPLSQPERIVDSRVGKGLSTMTAKQTQQFTAPDAVLGPDPVNAYDMVGNLTAVRPTAATFLTVYPDYGDETERPLLSSLNPAAGQTVANHAYVGLGYGNKVDVYNAGGTVDVLLDVSGYFIYTSTGTDTGGAATRDQRRRAGASATHSVVAPTLHRVRPSNGG